MQTFMAAYLIVLAGVLWYVRRLGTKQRQLDRELESLRIELQQPNQKAA